MRLVSVSEFKDAIPVMDQEDATRYLATALDQVTLVFGSLLRTSFDKRTISDVFVLERNLDAYHDALPRFLLSQGFLTATPIQVLYGFTYSDLATATPADNSTLILNTSKGVLTQTQRFTDHPTYRLAGSLYPYHFMQVTYEAGYDIQTNTIAYSATDTTELETVYLNVPPWLKTAAITYGFELYRAMKEVDGKMLKKTGAGKQYYVPKSAVPPVSAGVMNLLAPYVRYVPTAFIPTVSA